MTTWRLGFVAPSYNRRHNYQDRVFELLVTFDVVLTLHRRYYVEIKCQLYATDEFLLQILLLAQHVSGTFMPIIRSSRVLHKWLLSVVFGAWFST
jgi:hypothetical protein